MLVASVAMIGTGIFCVANGSAAFLTLAFIVGAAFCLMGIVEIITGLRADFDISEKSVSITRDGLLMVIFGIVMLSGQVADDITAQMVFSMWITIEGILSFSRERLSARNITSTERAHIVINLIMIGFGIYIAFNTAAINFQAALLVGVAMIILGLRRFMLSFEVEYNRPSFITGNEEKLREAMEEEKRALAKAKEGIREQKNAQRRINRIKEDMAAEQDVINSAALRRAEREYEKSVSDDVQN